MTTRHIDAAITTEKSAMSTATGATLTNSVRIVYDDTLDTRQLTVLIDRIKERITEIEE